MEDLSKPDLQAEAVEESRSTHTTTRSAANSTLGSLQSARLPPVLDVPQAARLLGIGRTLAYELVRTNHWPTPVIRMGRLIRIPSGPLIELMSTGTKADSAAS